MTTQLTTVLLKRYEREAKIWSSLIHINILPFYGLVQRSSEIYLVSPWLEHGNLSRFLARYKSYIEDPVGQSKTPEASQVAFSAFKEIDAVRGIASGLSYLHEQDVIHGDLKAANVLLGEGLTPLLCDFGLTKDTEFNSTSPGLKGCGTSRWKSPELLEDMPKTKMTDIYAFGMTVVEILTMQVPFPRHSTPRVIKSVMAGDRPPFVPLSRNGVNFQSFWEIAARCWQADSRARPTADEIMDIMAVLEHEVDGISANRNGGAKSDKCLPPTANIFQPTPVNAEDIDSHCSDAPPSQLTKTPSASASLASSLIKGVGFGGVGTLTVPLPTPQMSLQGRNTCVRRSTAMKGWIARLGLSAGNTWSETQPSTLESELTMSPLGLESIQRISLTGSEVVSGLGAGGDNSTSSLDTKDKTATALPIGCQETVQSPILDVRGMGDFPLGSEVLVSDVSSLASSASLRCEASDRSTNSLGLSAMEIVLARLPESPSVPPPPPPPGMLSVAQLAELGRQLSSVPWSRVVEFEHPPLDLVERRPLASFSNGTSSGGIILDNVSETTHQNPAAYSPKAWHMPGENRDRSFTDTSPTAATITTAPSPFTQSPAPVKQKVAVKKGWKAIWGSKSSSSSSSPSPAPSQSPPSNETSRTLAPALSTKPVPPKSPLRNEVARGPGVSSVSAMRTSGAPLKLAQATGRGLPAAVASVPTPRVALLANTSTSPPNLRAPRKRQDATAPSRHSSITTTDSYIPLSASASTRTSSRSSILTEPSNSSVHSFSTMATSVASSARGNERGSGGEFAEGDRSMPRRRLSIEEQVDGIARELHEFRTSQHNPALKRSRSKGVPGGNNPKKPLGPHVQYEPVTFIPPDHFMRRGKSSKAPLDPIAEAKSDLSTLAANENKLAPIRGGRDSGKLMDVLPCSSDPATAAGGASASTLASLELSAADQKKSSANQKVQGSVLQKIFWG
ncbi:hypothetical protein FRB97_008945 [Tulasnella sp. 331]|nr:hypothetical protein FRB97_008945 [Tulasnella sp. 331]